MINLQEYLKNHTISDVETNFNIKTNRSKKYNNLVLFKYDQINSDFSIPLVKECRGIILDESDNFKIVSYPFNKFMNYGEGNADHIGWQDMSIYEKCDGSLIILYPYKGEWHVSTTGTPDASGNVSDFGFTFEDLFWKVFNTYDQELPDVSVNTCFFFELMTNYNKIVVSHPIPKLNLLGARNLDSLTELTVNQASEYFPKIPKVKVYSDFSSLEDVITTLADMPISQEGYVATGKITNGNIARFKMKAPAYCAAHHLKDGLKSNRSLVQVVLSGEVSEVSTVLPEYKEQLEELDIKYKDIVKKLNDKYNEIKDVETQKEFAMYAVVSECSSVLFALRAKKSASVEEHLRKMHIDSVVKLFGLKTTL